MRTACLAALTLLAAAASALAQPPGAAAAKADPKLDPHLEAWEKKTADVKSMAAEITLKRTDAVSVAQFTNSQFDPSVTWKDVEWLRSVWSGPLVLKGISCAEDARRAVELGVEALVVSNHGGRQLDFLPGAIDVLAGAKLIMGVPLYAVLLWVTWLLVRTAWRASEEGESEPTSDV